MEREYIILCKKRKQLYQWEEIAKSYGLKFESTMPVITPKTPAITITIKKGRTKKAIWEEFESTVECRTRIAKKKRWSR